jgi:tryptophan halogenase
MDILHGIITTFNKMKKIIVLGGGTAGWLTALFINKKFPNYKITLIEGETIGTIGVGEGTTPHIINFLRNIDIDPFHLIKNIKGTIKNGISFENWNGDNKKYFHGFSSKNDLLNFFIYPVFGKGCYDYYLKHLIKNKLNFNDYVYSNKISYENKIDLNNMDYAIHFDTTALSDYLKPIALTRGINFIKGDFENVNKDNKGLITSVILKNKINIDCDFIFDCSGFSKLIIGKHYNEEWISYKKYLPVNSAIMFPRTYKKNEKIFPYTKSIALKNGWVFEIPLQHRIGRGYIFDNTYINEEQAINEVENTFNEKIEVKKIIKFDAGRLKNSWVKNCISIGLSYSFVEPLEATSIWTTTQQLETLSHFFNHLFNQNKESIELYNEINNNNLDTILNFIYMHYITKRKDSEFWINIKNYIPPNNFEKKLKLIKENNIRFFDLEEGRHTASFDLTSFLLICNGLEMFEKPINLDYYENMFPTIQEYKQIIDHYSKNIAMDHELFLKNI